MNFDKNLYSQVFRQQGYADEDGATLLLRTQLLIEIKNHIEKNNWTQVEAARILKVRQPRISELYRLRIDKFSIELLVKYLFRLQKHVNLTIKAPTVLSTQFAKEVVTQES